MVALDIMLKGIYALLISAPNNESLTTLELIFIPFQYCLLLEGVDVPK